MADAQSIIDAALNTATDGVTNIGILLANEVTAIKTIVDSVSNILNEVTYGSIPNKISNFLEDIQKEIEYEPDRPTNLGNFTIGTLPAFPTLDVTPIKTKINDIFDLIDTIPSRIDEAVTILDLVSGKINTDLVSGGYGIDERDELAIWERARDKELFIAGLDIAKLKFEHTGMGLPIPQGIFIKLMSDKINDTQKGLSTLSRDISIKRSDLFREARKYAIEKGIEIGKENFALTTFRVQSFRDTVGLLNEALKIEIENHKERMAVDVANIENIFKEQQVFNDEFKNDITAWNNGLVATIQAAETSHSLAATNLGYDTLELQYKIAHADAVIKQFGLKTSAHIASMEGTTHVLAASVAGAFSSINALAEVIEGG
jgi:hypothetical protein